MPRLSRTVRTAISAALIVGLFFYLQSGPENPTDAVLLSCRQEIEAAFDHAWVGYSTYCKGHDTLHPVTNTCDDDFGGWSATAIDALSTAIIMGKQDTVLEILRIVEDIDFSIVKGGTNIQLFEVNIRHFGGMLSAWDLLNGPFEGMITNERLMQVLYSQMVRLGDILSCAFNTPTGIPKNWVDPLICAPDDGTSNTIAGIGTLVLEFSRLSDITGNDKYAKLVRRAEEYLLNPQPGEGEPFPGLLGSFVDIYDGHMIDDKGSWGSLADCESLLKRSLDFFLVALKATVMQS